MKFRFFRSRSAFLCIAVTTGIAAIDQPAESFLAAGTGRNSSVYSGVELPAGIKWTGDVAASEGGEASYDEADYGDFMSVRAIVADRFK